MAKLTISINVDPDQLGSYTDSHLAFLWHLAQHNPAPFGDHTAGELVKSVGWEIVRRWLATVPPEMYVHQADHNYHKALTGIATYQPPEGVKSGDPGWYDGTWVPKVPEKPEPMRVMTYRAQTRADETAPWAHSWTETVPAAPYTSAYHLARISAEQLGWLDSPDPNRRVLVWYGKPGSEHHPADAMWHPASTDELLDTTMRDISEGEAG